MRRKKLEGSGYEIEFAAIPALMRSGGGGSGRGDKCWYIVPEIILMQSHPKLQIPTLVSRSIQGIRCHRLCMISLQVVGSWIDSPPRSALHRIETRRFAPLGTRRCAPPTRSVTHYARRFARIMHCSTCRNWDVFLGFWTRLRVYVYCKTFLITLDTLNAACTIYLKRLFQSTSCAYIIRLYNTYCLSQKVQLRSSSLVVHYKIIAVKTQLIITTVLPNMNQTCSEGCLSLLCCSA